MIPQLSTEKMLKANVQILGEEESLLYLSDLHALTEAKTIIDYAFPVLKNFENCLSCFENKSLLQKKNNTPFVFSEINRLFCNAVDSYYIFSQYCEKLLKWPKPIISEWYDKYFEFKFIVEIRNYSIHHRLPLTQLNYTYGPNDAVQCTANIQADVIITDKTISRKLGKDLINVKTIDIKNICSCFYFQFSYLLEAILVAKPQLFNSFSNIKDLITNKDGKLFSLTVLKENEKELDAGKVINNFLLDFSGIMDRFGFYGGKHQYLKLEKMFASFCKKYYGQENCYPRISCIF